MTAFHRTVEAGELDWQDDAACLGKDPDLFFPGNYDSYEPAKAVCRECVVRGACLAYALAHPELTAFGVWGGTSPAERRVMLRRNRRRAS